MPVMRNAGGYVRVYRSLLDWEWYDDDACVRLMLHLLLTVNWEPKDWHGQKIEAGQLVTSIEKLAEKLRLSRSTIRRALDKLKSTGELTIQTNNHWTTLTLANWGEYQEAQPTNGRQKSQPTTNRRPTNDQPAATTKEGEEGKKGNIEEMKEERVALVWPVWSSDRFKEVWAKWKAYKAERKEGYKPIGEQMALTAIGKEFFSESEAIEATEHSMGKGWAGVYRQKQERGTLRPTAPQPEVKFKAGY